jgi:hypothetical protein
MFQNCSSLLDAPYLSAPVLNATSCYCGMFNGCSSLTGIEVAFSEWNDLISATMNWVSGVAPTGNFVCPNDLLINYGVDRIPEGWLVNGE